MASQSQKPETPYQADRIEFQLPSLPDQGNLDSFPFPEILYSCYFRKNSGTLRVRHQYAEKHIYILDGHLAYADSDLRSETLGNFLVKTGKISDVEHRMIIEQMRQTGHRQSDLIIENKLLNPNDLYECLLLHVTEKVINCFAWKEGDFTLKWGNEWSGNVLNLKIDPSQLILTGIKRHYEPENLGPLTVLPEKTRVYLRLETADSLSKLKLSPPESRITKIAALNPKLEELYKQAKSDRADVDRLLYALFILGHLGFDTREHIEPVETPLPAKFEEDTDEEEEPGTENAAHAEEVIEDYLKLKDADFFTLLDIERDAKAPDIHDAFRQRSAQFHPDTVSKLPQDVRDKAGELYIKVLSGYRLLANPARRKQYLEELERKEEEKPVAQALESDELLERAKTAINKKEYERAVEKIHQALLIKPHEPLYQAWLGWALYLSDPRKKRKHAEKQLELARRHQPDMAEPYLFMARIFEFEGVLEKAAELYSLAAAKAPDNLEYAREAQLYSVRMRKGRTKKLGLDSDSGKSDSALNQDVGALISKLFKSKK